jgi:hypothetical protein
MQRRKWSSKDKLTIVLEGLKGADPERSQDCLAPSKDPLQISSKARKFALYIEGRVVSLE